MKESQGGGGIRCALQVAATMDEARRPENFSSRWGNEERERPGETWETLSPQGAAQKKKTFFLLANYSGVGTGKKARSLKPG